MNCSIICAGTRICLWGAFFAISEFPVSPLASLTCVTTEHKGRVVSKSLAIIYHHIAPKLFWGFHEKRTLYGSYKVAEPEKALLDWIYLLRQRGLPADTDELDVSGVDRAKLLDYANRYPKPVKQQVTDLLAEFAAGRGGSRT